VKVTIKNLQKKIPIYPKRIKKAVLKILAQEGFEKSGEITVCFVSDKQIRELNLMYLGKYSPTDVMSFDISRDKKQILADVVVSTDTALRNAKIFKTSSQYELYLYVVHGVLHLLGYDDNTLRKRKIMEEKTSQILKTLN
jgi:probable rRNA maturation factor